ncbi:MAG: ABC transporter ATP-binding protein [Anaerofustis sp.]
MFKKFIQMYKPHKKLLVLDMSAAFLMSAIDLAFPVVTGKIIDDIIPSKDFRLLIILCASTIFAYGMKYLFEYIVTFYGHTLGLRIEVDLRERVYRHLQSMSFSFYDNQKTGHIISRLTNDIFDISEFAHHGPEDLFISVIILIGSFIAMIQSNVILTVIIFLIVPIMILSAIRNNMKWENAYMDVKKQNAEISAHIEDSISGIRVVKAFTNEDYEIQRFGETCKTYKNVRAATYKFMASFVSNMHFYTGLLNIIVIFIGGYLVYADQMTIGVLIEFLMFVNVFVQPVRRFTSLIEDYQKSVTGFKRCMEVLALEPEIQDAPDALDAGTLKGYLVFDHVSFAYGNDIPILQDFSLHIQQGETVAIVGPSGAGKTTLCSLIPRFYEITSGKILIDQTDIRNFTQESLRRNIGVVQQDVFLFNGSVKDNIAYGRVEASDDEIIQAAKFSNLHEFIMELPNGYDTIVGERGVKLSGGQKQRVAIARTFLKNPPILILDEATSSLDNENEKIIQQSFDNLAKNRTTLIIAHRLQTIENAGRIIVMSKGSIIEEGTHRSLIEKNGVYAKLYNAQTIESQLI